MSDAILSELERKLSEAVARFWNVRDAQAQRQGGEDSAAKDRGARGAVTGGKQMDGFIELVRDLLIAAGLNNATIFAQSRTEVPGWFRSEKD